GTVPAVRFARWRPPALRPEQCGASWPQSKGSTRVRGQNAHAFGLFCESDHSFVRHATRLWHGLRAFGRRRRREIRILDMSAELVQRATFPPKADLGDRMKPEHPITLRLRFIKPLVRRALVRECRMRRPVALDI